MKIIEFIVVSEQNNMYHQFTMNAEDIVGIEGYKLGISKLHTRQNGSFLIAGLTKCLISRWIYVLSKKNSLVDDKTARPSLVVLYDIKNLESDNILLDEYQVKALTFTFYDKNEIENLPIQKDLKDFILKDKND